MGRVRFGTSLLLIMICLAATAQKKKVGLLRIEPIPEEKVAESAPAAGVADSGSVTIQHIRVQGNHKTKTPIILRELGIYPGEKLRADSITTILDEARQRLVNTSLFLTVRVYLSGLRGRQSDLRVDVTERWYTFPIPVFSLADRNFNVWWVEERHRLDRINFGVNVYQYNLTGRNDRLALSVQQGYTHRYAITYQLPYFDRKLRQGLGVNIIYSQNRELNYQTSLNKQQYFKQDQFLKKEFSAGIFYTYKKAIRLYHQLSLSYNFQSVADTILRLNPRYFPDDHTIQRYLELSYRFNYNGADQWAYPLEGTTISAQLTRRGFGLLGNINETQLYMKASRYWTLFPKTYLVGGLRGEWITPERQPYFLLRGMGYYEDYLRGLEYYVADADRYGILKTELKREMLAFQVRSSLLPHKFSVVPVRIYAKIFSDLGYAHSLLPGNELLNNKLLYTYGAGLDFVTFYDIHVRVEYSFNQLGEKGLFLHTKAEF